MRIFCRVGEERVWEKGGGEEGVKLIRIVSGGINLRYKVFQRLVLGEVEREDWDDPWERVRVEHVQGCCAVSSRQHPH